MTRKTTTTPKRKPGRPTKYRPEMCTEVVELAKGGLGVAEIGSELGVHPDTMYEWIKVHAPFSDAMTHARRESRAWWERKAREGIVTANGVSINAALWGKIMSARFPDEYREKKDVRLSGKLSWQQLVDEVAGE